MVSDSVSWAATANNLLVLIGGPALIGLVAVVPLYEHFRQRQVDCKVAVLKRVFAMGGE
jgi:hypothetical protein